MINSNKSNGKYHGIKIHNIEDKNIEENEQWYGSDNQFIQSMNIRHREEQSKNSFNK